MKKADLVRILLPLIIFFGVVFCLRHGVVVRNSPDLHLQPIAIIIFHVISLFSFGAKDLGAPIAGPLVLQWLMYFFYFISPIVTIVALADVLSLIRPIFVRWVLFSRPYYLILGYGRVGKSALDSINIIHGSKSFILVLDKIVDESENGLSILFEHNIFFRRDLKTRIDWNKFVSKRCKGVFILTDDEFLNLKLYHQIKNKIGDDKFYSIRIRSIELSTKLDQSELYSKDKFVNIHMVTSDMLFLEENDEKCKNISTPVRTHYNEQRKLFESIKTEEYHSVCFIGFGTFSQNLLNNLINNQIVGSDTEIIIFDTYALKNWELFTEQHGEYTGKKRIIPEDVSTSFDLIFGLEQDTSNKSVLLISATNNEINNIQLTSYIKGKMKNKDKMRCLIRTKNEDLIHPDLLSKLLNDDKFIIVPTYYWINIYFERLLAKQIELNINNQSKSILSLKNQEIS